MEAEPGFFKAKPVAYSGLDLKGELVETLTMTDGITGGIQLGAMRHNAHVQIRTALDASF